MRVGFDGFEDVLPTLVRELGSYWVPAVAVIHPG
jgi:hypothetical protein